MKIQMPSKKVIHFLSAVIIFFTIFFSYTPIKNILTQTDFRGKVSIKATPSLISSDVKAQSDVDSDNDGLKDWQESLWLTNSQNKDTDSDGTSDGEEVKLGRDPNKTGPNDTYVGAKPYIDDTLNEKSDNLSVQLSHSLFGQFISQSGDDQFISGFSEQNIVTGSLSSLKAGTIPNKYNISNVKTFADLSTQKTKEFGNKFMEINIKALKEMDKLNEAQTIVALEKLTDNLSKLSVPISLSEIYLKILNDYYAEGELVKIIIRDKEDPVKSLLAIKSIQEVEADIQIQLKSIANYFKNNAIIFSNEEPGNAWNNLQK